MDKLISSTTFMREYLKNIPAEFEWQKTPLQIYPLSFLKNHFDLPLPVLRADYNFIFFIREGHFEQRLGTNKHRAVAGSIVFVSTDTVSALESISEDVKGYFVLIEDESMANLFNQDELLNILMIDPVIKLHPGDSDWITGLLRLLYAELDTPPGNLHTANNLVQALLHKILHLSDHLKPVSRAQQVAIQFKQLVHQNYVEERGTPFYAEQLAMSENYLNRCVKSVFGRTCKDIIIETTILNSQILMGDVSKSISEISYELNFHDPSYFTRLFKKVTGVTPTEYRTKVLQELS